MIAALRMIRMEKVRFFSVAVLCSFVVTSVFAIDGFSRRDSVKRIDTLIAQFDGQTQFVIPPSPHGNNIVRTAHNIQLEHCGEYPYHEPQAVSTGFHTLITDIKAGLRKGLQCMSGLSENGRLHPFHEEQAKRLMSLIESQEQKTFRCVQDKMLAFAVANTRPDLSHYSSIDLVIRDLPYPAVVLDTYRISGFISNAHKPSVYRDFFKLNEEQIARQLAGKPEHIDGLHRYHDRAGLVFHEMLHWLGNEHTNLDPDPVFLYETCCFGGSDFIDNEQTNAAFQRKACAILKDSELWEANKYKQMRLWRYKQYDDLKRAMREKYN